MSFARPRIARHFLSACLVAVTGLIFAITVGEAREKLRKQSDGVIEEIQRPSRHGYEDVIVEMAPLHPWRGAAVKPSAPAAATLAKPAPAKDAEPVEAAAKAPEPASSDVQQVPSTPAAKAVDALKEDPQKEAAKTVAGESVKDAASNTAVSGEKKADVKNASGQVPGQSETQPGTAAAPAVSAAANSAAPVTNPTANAAAPTAPASAVSAAAIEATVQPAAPQQPAAANAGNSGPAGAPAPSPVAIDPAPLASAASAIQPDATQLQPVTNAGAPPQAIAPPQASLAIGKASETDAKPIVLGEPLADPSKASNPTPISPVVAQAPQGSAALAPAQAPTAAVVPLAQEQNPAPLVAKGEAQPNAPKPQAEAVAPQTIAPAVVQNEEAKAYDILLARGIKGPSEVRLSERATMWLPAGRVFLEAEQARKLLGVERGSWDDATQGVVLPSAGGPQWMAYVDLLDDGYIKDDESKSLDANLLLATYKAGVASQNPGRIRLGLTPLEVTGWLEAPTYDAKHHLSSCIGATGQGSQKPEDRIVNCTSFALGRQGAIKVIVAGDEAAFAHFKGEAATLANTIVYDKGETYEDADLSMDRVAGYGLVGLLTGAVALKKLAGAAVVASVAKKAGLLAIVVAKVLKLWKLLLGGLAIILLGVRWVSRKRKPAKAEVREEKPVQPVKPVSAPIWTRAMVALRAKFAKADHKAAAPQDASAGAALEQTAAIAEQSESKALASKGSLFATLREKAASIRIFHKSAEKAPDDGAMKASSNDVAGEAPYSTVQAAAQSPGSALSKLASLMRGQAPQAAQANAESASESPASALAKLAARMRKQSPQAVVAVDLSRATNRKSQVIGASSGFEAPTAVSSDLRASSDLPNQASKSVVSQPSAANAVSVPVASMAADSAVLFDDPLGLVEPGDEAAAASAISAREALREAQG